MEFDIEKAEELLKVLGARVSQLKQELKEVENELRKANEEAILKHGLGRYVLKVRKRVDGVAYDVAFKEVLDGKETPVNDERVKELLVRRHELLKKYRKVSKPYNKLRKLLREYRIYKEMAEKFEETHTRIKNTPTFSTAKTR